MKGYGTGLGLCDVLFIVFLTLKLTHIIDWSWWCITAPIWIPFGILLIIWIILKIFDKNKGGV